MIFHQFLLDMIWIWNVNHLIQVWNITQGTGDTRNWFFPPFTQVDVHISTGFVFPEADHYQIFSNQMPEVGWNIEHQGTLSKWTATSILIIKHTFNLFLHISYVFKTHDL